MKNESKNKNGAGIMIVDDHPFVRYGLKQLISAEPDLAVCCEAGSCREALETLETSNPDLAIVDLSLKDGSGIELIKDMRKKYPSVPVLVLSMHDESLYAERALKAGAKGYIMKQEGTEILVKAIRSILSGQIFVSRALSSKLITKKAGYSSASEDSCVECLSDRELQVFELIGKGLKTSSIAELLNLSVKTIETYRGNIKMKLDLTDASELFREATLWVASLGGK